MNNFFIVSNGFTDENFVNAKNIKSYIIKNKGVCSIADVKSSMDCSVDISPDDVPSDCECIIVLGGDGTLIRTAGALASKNLPVVGVNLGHLGYLCELNTDMIETALDKIISDNYIIEERMMLHGKSEACSNMRYAINDIVIGRKNSISMISLKVTVNGEFLNTFECDGIVIATPTGSTGYNMSANGPIVEPTTELILLNPLNEHNLNSKCLVLDKGSVIEIEVLERRKDKQEKATVICDGVEKGELNHGDVIRIRRAGTHVKILKFSNVTFLETLRRKMER
ncbi:MAG: NAD(+)/NADH kinase [Lachnospiraceae bacterium]|nr:NAD(+)/NADH kinase [Lachnospiraceae bacterium]